MNYKDVTWLPEVIWYLLVDHVKYDVDYLVELHVWLLLSLFCFIWFLFVVCFYLVVCQTILMCNWLHLFRRWRQHMLSSKSYTSSLTTYSLSTTSYMMSILTNCMTCLFHTFDWHLCLTPCFLLVLWLWSHSDYNGTKMATYIMSSTSTCCLNCLTLYGLFWLPDVAFENIMFVFHFVDR